MNAAPTILFVYNADSGLFNLVADIGHKIFSPDTYACDLCALTHGHFRERNQWREFIKRLDCKCQFMHRDEFHDEYPDSDTQLPAVFTVHETGVECCLDAQSIAECRNLIQLQSRIGRQCCPGNDNTKQSN